MRFTGIAQAGKFRSVTRAHIIAWRDDLLRRTLSGMTIRHRLPSLVSRASALVQLALYGSRLPAQALRDLANRKLLEVAQQYHFKVVGRK